MTGLIDGRFRAVLFDFDYTLADSSAGIVECVNHALGRGGRPPADHDAIRRTIGLSLTETYRRLTGDDEGASASAFSKWFIEKADEVMVDRTVVFDSVAETVKRLRAGGLSLGVVSTKYRHRIDSILRRDGLRDGFDVIVGGEDVSRLKPDPEGVLLGASRIPVDVGEALYVGDSLTDAEAARRAGMPFAAVLTGVTEREEFADLGVEWIVGSIAQL